jgi:spermidine synthase
MIKTYLNFLNELNSQLDFKDGRIQVTKTSVSSGPEMENLFYDIIKEYCDIESLLVLGWAGGSIAGLIKQFKYSPYITAVELDKRMIDIYNKKFKKNHYKKLELINDDAIDYVKDLNKKFDTIIIDVFDEGKVPEPFWSIEFVYNILKCSNCIIWNSHGDINELTKFAIKIQKEFNIKWQIKHKDLNHFLIITI